jgi:cellulose biosynthesis protein BcsQ
MKVVAVYNMKGGVGKTTTAVNLAFLSAASGTRTLLWDLDAQAASTFAFRVKPEVPGFGRKFLQEPQRLLGAIKGTDYDNLDLLPADFAYRKIDRVLERLERDRSLTEVLDDLGRDHAHIILDCPAGFSLLTQAILSAASVVIVPTIPTVLSLRTLARLLTSWERRAMKGRLVAFLSMVDRRKALHRRIAEWAEDHPDLFLPAQIPYASIVEQTSVRRAPLAVVAPQDPATTAFDALWQQVTETLDARTPALDALGCARLAAAIARLLAELGGEASPKTQPRGEAGAPAPGARTSPSTTLAVALPGDHAFSALMRELSVTTPPQAVPQLVHVFDTEDGVLLDEGYVLELVEEPRRFTVAARRMAPPGTATSSGEHAAVAHIDGRWAAQILSGRLSPVAVLERRLEKSQPPVVVALARLLADRPLRRTAWCKRLRQSAGTVVLPLEATALDLGLDFDTVTSASGRVSYEVAITAGSADGPLVEAALRRLWSRLGLEWEPLTAPRWPSAPPRQSTGTGR